VLFQFGYDGIERSHHVGTGVAVGHRIDVQFVDIGLMTLQRVAIGHQGVTQGIGSQLFQHGHAERLPVIPFGRMQGVVKAFNPTTGDGIVLRDTDLTEYELAPHALEGSIFRMLRQGQRVNFSLDAAGRATQLRIGSERDMGTPGY
jgi:CspA family cold shock protein